MSVYVNRTLNLKKIKMIGFDMDYTLVRYNTEAFESLTHSMAKERLVEEYDYPRAVLDLEFNYELAIPGLIVDTRFGNLLNVSRFGKVKTACHGSRQLDYKEVQALYQKTAIEIEKDAFRSLDTSFSLSNGVLFSQIVDLKTAGIKMPEYRDIAQDIYRAVDDVHRNGTLKERITADFKKYVIQDPFVVPMLERFIDYGKKLMIITNSDYSYTKKLLDYAFNPFMKDKSWEDLFELIITSSAKPRFFEGSQDFLEVDPASGMLKNYSEPLKPGIYQGGWFKQIEEDFEVQGPEILYFGDHIYGDVVSIKRSCDWRTGLVLWELEKELEGLEKSKDIQHKIDKLMKEKTGLEKQINRLDLQRYAGTEVPKAELDDLYNTMDSINTQIGELIDQHKTFFNRRWGEILRAGNEESRFAEQLERYACVYMVKVSDLYEYSPKTYFRPKRRLMPHELKIMSE